jgi:putative membrane protein
MLMNGDGRFWREVFSHDWRTSVTGRVIGRTMIFGVLAAVVAIVNMNITTKIGMGVGPHQLAGAALGLLLVLRTNASYERWNDGRKHWGYMVNATRNLAIAAVSYGPPDRPWRQSIVRWIIVFAIVCRASLRNQQEVPELEVLLGSRHARDVLNADHMPNYVSMQIAALLKEARDAGTLDAFGFVEAERYRGELIDAIGGCERILRTPLASVYSIKIRQFIFLFLATLPFAMLLTLRAGWTVPIVTMLIAYPILAIDQIGHEIQNPFAMRNLGHLPLNDITRAIESNLLEIEKNSASAQIPAPVGEA